MLTRRTSHPAFGHPLPQGERDKPGDFSFLLMVHYACLLMRKIMARTSATAMYNASGTGRPTSTPA